MKDATPYLLNCNGKLLDLSTPQVMGILNITPDSFYDGGKYLTEKAMLERASEIMEEGGTIIDIGGCSARPGSVPVGREEEMKRVIPAVKMIVREFPETVISMDTFRSEVARAAVGNGASMINDISGGMMDETMFETVSSMKVPYILMHMQGNPATMQQNPEYNDVVKEIISYFIEKLHRLRQMGVADMIIDPGFGFGKSLNHNYEILNHLGDFQILEVPVMAGVSRKSMISSHLGIKPEDALNGTTVLNTVALLNGANILRVHDVKEAVEAVKIVQRLKDNG